MFVDAIVFLLLKYAKSGTVLEIGCGFGDLISNLEGKFNTIGVDVSEHACNIARKRTSKSEIINQDAIEYLHKAPDCFFDAIIQICVIPHMEEDPKEVLAEIARVMKQGGVLLSVVPNPHYPLNRLKGKSSAMYIDKTHKCLFKVEKWRKLFEESGLISISEGSTGWWDVPYLPLIPNYLQLVFFGLPSVVQIALGDIVLPPWMGVDWLAVFKKM